MKTLEPKVWFFSSDPSITRETEMRPSNGDLLDVDEQHKLDHHRRQHRWYYESTCEVLSMAGILTRR